MLAEKRLAKIHTLYIASLWRLSHRKSVIGQCVFLGKREGKKMGYGKTQRGRKSEGSRWPVGLALDII